MTATRSSRAETASSRKTAQRWRGRRFVITRADLDVARQTLGIASPIEIRLTRYRDGTCGRVIGFRDGRWIVGLDTYLSPRQASLTLWHELVHIHQAERIGGLARLDQLALSEAMAAGLAGRGPRPLFRTRAYRRMPHEREAEEVGRREHRWLKLASARARRRRA